MTDNLIQWPRAKYWNKPWNPIIGCVPCSPACEHCYARALVSRFNMTGVNAPDFKPTWKEDSKPPKKGVVFCGNMTDLFGEFVEYPQHYVVKAVDAAETADAMLFLTKRAGHMAQFLREYGPVQDWQDKGWLCNVYFGFTAENQEWYERRWSDMCMAPQWANLWLSAEPLLGPIDLADVAVEFQWVVVGCESGRGRRPCKIEWVESIVGQCRAAGVPVFVKQLDIGGRCVTDINKFPAHLRIRQVPWNKE